MALWVCFLGEGGGIPQAAGSLIPAAGLSASQMAGPGQSPGSQPSSLGEEPMILEEGVI